MFFSFFILQVCHSTKDLKLNNEKIMAYDFAIKQSQPYEIAIINNISLNILNLTIAIKNTDNNETIILESGMKYYYSSNASFKIQILLKTGYCSSRIIRSYSFSDQISRNITQIINDDSIPKVCIPYEICILSKILSNYPLKYIKRNLSNLIIETKSFEGELRLFDSYNFSVDVYLDDQICDNISIIKKTASKNDVQCNEITNSSIIDYCKNDFYRVFFDLSGIKYYRRYFVYRFSTEEQFHNFTGKDNSFKFALNKPFSVEIALNYTPGCSFYAINKTYVAKIDKNPKIINLYDSMVPKICLDTLYWIFLKNSITLEGVTLYIKDRFNKYIEIPYDTVYNDSNTFEFEYSLYITTYKCRERKLICYKKSIYMNYNTQFIDNSLLLEECLDDKHEICFDFSGVPNKYSIGYIRDNDPSNKIFPVPIAKEILESKIPFSLKFYLISSPGCGDEMIFLGSLASQSRGISSCTFFNEAVIPEKCRKYHDPTKTFDVKTSSEIKTQTFDAKTSSEIYSQSSIYLKSLSEFYSQIEDDSSGVLAESRKSNAINIIIGVVVSFVAVIIIVIICLILYLKKKKKQYLEFNTSKSSMQSNLIISENTF